MSKFSWKGNYLNNVSHVLLQFIFLPELSVVSFPCCIWLHPNVVWTTVPTSPAIPQPAKTQTWQSKLKGIDWGNEWDWLVREWIETFSQSINHWVNEKVKTQLRICVPPSFHPPVSRWVSACAHTQEGEGEGEGEGERDLSLTWSTFLETVRPSDSILPCNSLAVSTWVRA